MNSIASSYVSRRIGRNATYGGRWVEVWILRAVRGEWMASSGRWQKTVVFGSTKRGAARESILGGSRSCPAQEKAAGGRAYPQRVSEARRELDLLGECHVEELTLGETVLDRHRLARHVLHRKQLDIFASWLPSSWPIERLGAIYAEAADALRTGERCWPTGPEHA